MFTYLDFINCTNVLKKTNTYHIKQLQTIFKTVKTHLYLNHDSNQLYLKNLNLRRMDDVTELAQLAEQQEIRDESRSSVTDTSQNVFKPETSLGFDDDVVIEEIPNREVIIGSVQKRIIHAKRRIDDLIQNSKNTLSFTHFISIPTNVSDVKQHFLKFKEDVLQSYDEETTGLHENIFQKPEKLHLTICMLHLLEKSDERKAIRALNACKKEIIDPLLENSGPLTLEFRGLKCMQNNPTNARVLFAKVQEETGLLQKMSDQISKYFIQQGLSRKKQDNVKLHMTLMNTFYLKKNKYKFMKKKVDATQILKDHENTYFGKVILSTFHLSRLTAKSADGYFEATAKIEV